MFIKLICVEGLVFRVLHSSTSTVYSYFAPRYQRPILLDLCFRERIFAVISSRKMLLILPVLVL